MSLLLLQNNGFFVLTLSFRLVFDRKCPLFSSGLYLYLTIFLRLFYLIILYTGNGILLHICCIFILCCISILRKIRQMSRLFPVFLYISLTVTFRHCFRTSIVTFKNAKCRKYSGSCHNSFHSLLLLRCQI